MYSTGMGGRHTTAIGGVADWPTLPQLRAVGRQASLETAHIAADLDQVRSAVADVTTLLRDLGCARDTIALLTSRFGEVDRRAQ
jgi:hypothetical protein